MNLIRRLAHSYHPGGIGTYLRMKRHAILVKLIQTVPAPVMILDVGGSESYWKVMERINPPQIQIVLLNLAKEDVSRSPNMQSIVGDATNMKGLDDQSFDIVFSNSVIEHVGDFEAQRLMAKEVTRVGRRYFIQTPNFWFPIEPHFLFPGFHWLPMQLRIWLVQHFKLGWNQRTADPEQAHDLIAHNRLLTKREFQSLFPNATLYEEKVFGLTKSFILYGGWD